MGGGFDRKDQIRAMRGNPKAISRVLKQGIANRKDKLGKPSYDANIDVGTKYDPRNARANDPTMQQAGPQTGQLQGPGMGEQFAQRHANRMTDPSQTSMFGQQAAGQMSGAGQGEQFWNKVQGQFNAPTNAQQAYDAFQKGPGFDAYYDRARERTAGGINDQLAARGMYGSSAGMDQLGQSMVDLNAQQANREADYMLQQQQAMVGAAQGADAQNQALLGLGMQGAMGAQDAMQGRLMGAQGMLNMGDQMNLSRMQLGGEMAAQGQGLQRQRMQDMFGNAMGLFEAQQRVIQPALYGMLQGDRSLVDAAMAGEMGLGAEAVAQDRYDEARADAWAKTGLSFLGDAAGAATGGM